MIKKYAAFFPGQDVLYSLHKISSMYYQYKIIQDTFNEVSDIIGYDLWKAIQNRSLLKLCVLHHQSAIITVSIALYQLWIQKSNNIIPSMILGHSLGEYTALVCSKIITLYDAIKIINIRNKLMYEVSYNLYDYNMPGYYMQVIIGLKKKL
ncbi:acyltransferase domain-containing protein [Enterobacteriaceae endosymbiont of Macroplea appendiculata]|uniref:acyltransferase domain-containing protein n=1 Tax=Enterobacteriaceae endosymbiont of Macroplea appendiculata TaxID=2675790 RepID=UPI001448C031|nr:acyltransferase domain-containing protein [Enterobacteriaceae endosymbiont of Macroplea appendiculata]QJC30704.1 acyltransferase domain-containing protein [Enterobacteriaceae endosymbiont of Macroplea appendiculata]